MYYSFKNNVRKVINVKYKIKIVFKSIITVNRITNDNIKSINSTEYGSTIHPLQRKVFSKNEPVKFTNENKDLIVFSVVESCFGSPIQFFFESWNGT